MSVGGNWQSNDEIHADVFPLPGWNRQRLQRTGYFQVAGLNPLASVTLGHILGDFSLHSGPPKILFHVLVHLGTAWVDCKSGLMCLIQNLFPELVIFGYN